MWHDVKINGWKCNGGINPLIRTYAQLMEIAKQSGDADEAERWFNQYNRWDRHKPHRPTSHDTPAVYLAKHPCRGVIQCYGFDDLKKAVSTMGQWNNYNPEVIIPTLEKLNYLRYYPKLISGKYDNPNNCKEMFKWWFSPDCIQVEYYESEYGSEILSGDWKQWRDYNDDEFAKDMMEAGRVMLADASDFKGGNWRFWWD